MGPGLSRTGCGLCSSQTPRGVFASASGYSPEVGYREGHACIRGNDLHRLSIDSSKSIRNSWRLDQFIKALFKRLDLEHTDETHRIGRIEKRYAGQHLLDCPDTLLGHGGW